MSHSIIPSVQYCKSITGRRSPEDLKAIAHVKRFLELLTGDSKFRLEAKSNPAGVEKLARGKGVNIDVGKFSPKFLADVKNKETTGYALEFPLAVLWREWIEDWLTFVRMFREDGYSDKADPRFNAWRKRQVERVRIEFGTQRANFITHPIFSFELSKGCSVGCWFCAFGAESFKGHYHRTPENVQLWRNVLGTAVDMFGSAVQTAACYWATEPFDNPNYVDFIQDYYDIAGIVPQTTTAAPARDLVWTRRLMAMHGKYLSVPSRFSIVNSSVLKVMHSTFQPEELLGYELIMQLRGASYGKARSGKTLKKLNSANPSDNGSRIEKAPSSIACVSGYLINMVDRSIKLVSPCLADEEWPLGYRVHGSGTFDTAQDFGDFIETSMTEYMPMDLPADRPVSFREPLHYETREDGFDLLSASSSHSFTGSGHVRSLGDMIAEGRHRPEAILGSLVEAGADVFGILGTLRDLYSSGFLEDMPRAKDLKKAI